jgi:hypothetical protein
MIEVLEERRILAIMFRWNSFIAIVGATAGMLVGGLLAALPANADPYHHPGPPPSVVHREIAERRIALEREREHRLARHRVWVSAHWEYRDGHRYWVNGFWR